MQSIVESAPKKAKRGNPYRDANGRLTSKDKAVYDVRHLPGKHDQSKHGHGGGISPEQWKAITPGKGANAISARKALDATPEGKQLRATTKIWQDDVSGLVQIQKSFMDTANGKKISSAKRKHADSFMHGISKAPVSPPLYRGARISPEEIATFKKGKNIVLPPSSFTSKQRLAGGFAKQPSRRKVEPVVIRVKNGARALPVEVFGDSQYKNEAEWISAGQFTVTSVTKRNGVHIVDVDHTGMFQW